MRESSFFCPSSVSVLVKAHKDFNPELDAESHIWETKDSVL